MKSALVVVALVVIAGVVAWQFAAGPAGGPRGGGAKQNGPAPAPKAAGIVKEPTQNPPAKLPERPPVPTHKATLEVRAHTWRDAPPFDIAKDLAARLLQAGIEVVPKDQKADAMLLAEYDEEKGQSYRSFYGLGSDEQFGTAISLKLSVLSAEGVTLLALSVRASTPFSVEGDKSLQDAALDDLRADPNYVHVQDFVGGSLGIKASLSKLVGAVLWLDSREKALDVLDRQKYQPADGNEAAMFAIGRQDYAQCVKIGKPAVPPLLLFLDKYGYAEHVEKAARTLGEIGDPAAAEGLVKKLRYYVAVEHLAEAVESGSTHADDRKAAIAVIEALGKTADGFALGDLDPLAKSPDPSIAAAATQALAQIRGRLKNK